MGWHVNLTAYDEVESLDNFDESSFSTYCADRLAHTTPVIDFLRTELPTLDNQSKVIEIGSGNSALLYRLEQEGMLGDALGVEISASRHRFAEKFKTHIGNSNVHNLNENFLDMAPANNTSLVLGVDVVFQLIAALYEGADQDALTWIRNALSPEGAVVLELRSFDEYLSSIQSFGGTSLQLWEEFPTADPFEFVLGDISLDKEECLIWKKTFFKRGTMERSRFENVLKPYTPESITTCLEAAGFGSIKIFPGWKPGEDSSNFIVLARIR